MSECQEQKEKMLDAYEKTEAARQDGLEKMEDMLLRCAAAEVSILAAESIVGAAAAVIAMAMCVEQMDDTNDQVDEYEELGDEYMDTLDDYNGCMNFTCEYIDDEP